MFAPKVYTQDIKASQTLIRRLRLEKIRDVRALADAWSPSLSGQTTAFPGDWRRIFGGDETMQIDSV